MEEEEDDPDEIDETRCWSIILVVYILAILSFFIGYGGVLCWKLLEKNK